MGSYSEAMYLLPESIQNLIQMGVRMTQPHQIVLFGSRARGGFRENSDYDLAFKNINNPLGWTKFIVDVEHEPISLFKVDILDYNKCNTDYQKNIDKDGVILYGP